MLSTFRGWWTGLPEGVLASLLPVTTAVLVGLLVLSVLRYRRLRQEVTGLSLKVDTASRSLRNSDRDLRTLFDQSAIAVMLFDRASRTVLYANETALAAFGVRTEEQLNNDVMQRPDAWGETPYSLLEFEQWLDKASRSGLQAFEWLTSPKARKPVWLDVSLSVITFKGGQALMFTGVNITPRKQAEKTDRFRHLAMSSMANDSSLHTTLDHLTAMAEIALPGAQCGVMVYDVDNGVLRWVGGRSVAESFREALDRLPVVFGAASSGTAAFIRGRVVSRDIQADERWEHFCSQAEAAGLRACWSEPVFGSGGELLGTFDVYHEVPWTPGDDDIDGLTGPIALASLAIERYQAKGQLEQMVLSEQMVRRISTDLLTVEADETDEGINRTCRALGEYFRADRVFLCEVEDASEQIYLSHEWAQDGLKLLKQDNHRKFPVVPLHLQQTFADQASITLAADDDIPAPLAFVGGLLPLGRNQSVLLAVIHSGDRITGMLGIQCSSAVVNPWTPQRAHTAELMASLLASVLTRKELMHTLTFQAVHDQLTGLYNRHKIENFLSQEVARCSRYGSTFSLIIFDLDHFKSINDRYGHNEGDDVLSRVSEVIRGGIRESEIAGRWGGEEFLIILPETTLDQALPVAERIRASIEIHRFSIPDKVTISVGLSAYLPGDTAHEVIQRADAALYHAKESGRNCVKSSF